MRKVVWLVSIVLLMAAMSLPALAASPDSEGSSHAGRANPLPPKPPLPESDGVTVMDNTPCSNTTDTGTFDTNYTTWVNPAAVGTLNKAVRVVISFNSGSAGADVKLKHLSLETSSKLFTSSNNDQTFAVESCAPPTVPWAVYVSSASWFTRTSGSLTATGL